MTVEESSVGTIARLEKSEDSKPLERHRVKSKRNVTGEKSPI